MFHFTWTKECEFAFSQLKKFLTEAPILCYPQFGPDESFSLGKQMQVVLGLGAVS